VKDGGKDPERGYRQTEKLYVNTSKISAVGRTPRRER